MKTFDHVIIGTGQATGTLLGKFIPTGDSIAVIEQEKVGGSCVNYGCTPTKALVASAKALHKARQGDVYGFEAGDIRVDYSRIRERMNAIRNESRTGLVEWMEDTSNVELIRGTASFTGPHSVRVGDVELAGEKIYINVGTRPRKPDIAGIDGVPWMDSARILDLELLPEHLIIIGGGYIGAEFSQIYRRFGSRVTVIQRGERIMPREDEEVSNELQSILEDEGIEVLCNADAVRVSGDDKHVELTIQRLGKEQIIRGSHLLVAAGRIPNSDTLDLDRAGIKTNKRGYIDVDNFCRTNAENVFALGDVNGQGAFTHTSVNDAEIVLDHLFGGERTLSMRNKVYALFTDPPLGRAGMTEQEARKAGRKVLTATRPMSEISRAKEMGETKGFAKLIVDAETDLILGAAILGPSGDEVVNMFAAIMHSNIPCTNYRRVVLIHPTISELMPWVLDGISEARSDE